MCGICGIHHLASDKPVDAARVRRMNDQIIHRGPDEEGIYVEGPIGLGMRRLSIIDLKSGSQPFFNEDKSIAVIQNGEIYNFLSLKERLVGLGHRFTTDSDTEVILHAYQQYGLDFVHELNGMFAIAIWDANKQQLVLTRDRLGVKPLYYSEEGQRLIFGSEIKSILAAEQTSRDLDDQAVYNYLVLGYIPAPRSVYSSIAKLPPGSMLIARDGGTRITRYWSPEPTATYSGTKIEAIEELRFLFEDAVRTRMISDVPIGAFLSGGLDSSIVVAQMAEQSSTPVQTFFIDFDHQEHSERQFARAVANRFQTEHHEFTVDPNSLLSMLDSITAQFDEPFGDSSSIPTYHVSKLTRQHVTVALAGDGGDESFGGYRAYRRSLSRRSLARTRQRLAPACKAAYWAMPRSSRGRRAVRAFGMSNLDAFRSGMTELEVREACSPEFISRVPRSLGEDVAQPALGAMSNDPLTPYSQFDLAWYLPDDILTKVDRMSMANSLEVRAPFLDYRIIELAARLPVDWKISGNETKHILKEAFADDLPPEVTTQRKHGFSIPLSHWLRTDLKDSLEEAINDTTFVADYFRPESLRQMADEHDAKKRDWSSALWRILVLFRWRNGG